MSLAIAPVANDVRHGRLSGRSRKPTRDAITERQRNRCHYCQRVMNPTQPDHSDPLAASLDHVIPLGRGGTDDEANLVVACVSCNARKDDYLPWEFELAVRFGLA